MRDDYDDDATGGDDAFQDVLRLLRGRGIRLPPSVTEGDFLDTLRVALHALTGQQGGGRSTRQGAGPDTGEATYDGTERPGAPVTLSLMSPHQRRPRKVSGRALDRLAREASAGVYHPPHGGGGAA